MGGEQFNPQLGDGGAAGAAWVDGIDPYIDLPPAPWEASLGTKVVVPMLAGHVAPFAVEPLPQK